SVRRANSIAFDVRENGRVKTEDGTPSGKPVLDANGEPIRIPGMLKHVKAIGWFVKEYGIAQVSINLTNIEETPTTTPAAPSAFSLSGLALVTSCSFVRSRVIHASRLSMLLRPPKARTSCRAKLSPLALRV